MNKLNKRVRFTNAMHNMNT